MLYALDYPPLECARFQGLARNETRVLYLFVDNGFRVSGAFSNPR